MDQEKLELKKDQDLRIYCFSVRQRRATPISVLDILHEAQSQLPQKAHFYLGYSLDDVNASVAERFGPGSIDILMHGDISFKEMANKVKMLEEYLPEPPRAEVKIHLESPEELRMRFVNGIRLIADRYVSFDDKIALLEILGRVDVGGKVEGTT